MEMNDLQIKELLKTIRRKQYLVAKALMQNQKAIAENSRDIAARLLVYYYCGIEDTCKFIASLIERDAK